MSQVYKIRINKTNLNIFTENKNIPMLIAKKYLGNPAKNGTLLTFFLSKFKLS
jgi:hypothetical protein